MALTYQRTVSTTETRVLRIPNRWGMYSSKGNKRITKIMQDAATKIEALKEKGGGYVSERQINKILVQLLTKWVRLWYTKAYGESGDTDVRDQVGSFHDMLAEAAGIDRFNTYRAWERNYEEAQNRVYEERRRKKEKAQAQ